MTELEKIQRAKMYIDKLANGINPIDDVPVADTDIINNVRLSRCFFYVSDILRQVIENHGVVGKSKNSKKSKCPFFLSADSLGRFPFSDTPISVSEITKRLNTLVDSQVCCNLKYSAITSWLMEIGALATVSAPDGKTVKRPTSQGQTLGISTETRTGRSGEYTVIVYNKDAQHFILDNIEAIVDNVSRSGENAKNQGHSWTQEDEDCLADLFARNVSVAEIAATLMRTESGVRAKLKKMGLIEHRGDAE